MTIGELAVLLGFKVEGGEEFKKATDALDRSAGVAGKLALAVDSATAALGVMFRGAVNAAVGFQKFELATGLSADELQQWNYRAAVANVSAKEMADAIEGIQKAGIRVATTGEGAQPWVLLGIDPRQNPFAVLKQLQLELQNTDAKRRALARSITEQAGISRDVFQMLVRPDIGDLPKRYVFNEQDRAKMEAFNAEWQRLGFLTDQVKNRFSAQLSPALREVVIWLEKIVDRASKAVQWLTFHPRVAKTISELAIALGTLSVALTAYAAIAKTAALVGPALASGFGAAGAGALSLLATVNAIVEGYKLIQNYRHGNHETEDFIARNRGYHPPGRSLLNLGRGGSVGENLDSLIRPGGSFSASARELNMTNTFHINEALNAQRTSSHVLDTVRRQLSTAGFSAEPENY